MPSINNSVNISGLGISISKNTPRTADGGAAVEIAIPAGKVGTLSTRTDDETGTLTMDSGHGITTGAIIDLYWEGGSRHGITVGTVSSNTVPIGADDKGVGDDLPSQSTDIVAMVQLAFNCSIDGDELSLLAMQLYFNDASEDAEGYVSFLDDGDAEIEALKLQASVPRVFDIAGGDPNGFTGDPITNAVVTHGSAVNSAILKLVWVADATP